MLAPRDRRILLDALRPPPGYRLDRAIGTTFSLDLLALLTAPLAFTFLDWEDEDGRPTADPVALLEAIRRYSDRITIFCEAGRIAVPKPGQLLYGYLEGSVVEVIAPRPGAVFHPKLWLLRFHAESQPIRFRLLCLSRNLTFDRSWDTALVLDGELAERARAFAANHPLADLIDALPGLALRPLPAQVTAEVRTMADEVRRVRFELPADVDEIAFHTLGIEGYTRPPFPRDGRRMLVVSPFLSEGFLKRLAEDRPGSILVSRPDSLQALSPAALGLFGEVHVLSSDADPEDEDPTEATPRASDLLTGLHAKLYVEDDGWTGRVWTGSANATDAAFRSNVEILVELIGSKSRLGIDAFLGDADSIASGLRDLLQPFHRIEGGVIVASPLADALEEVRAALSRMRLRADVHQGAGEEFALVLAPEASLPRWPTDVSIVCHPITLRSEHGLALEAGSSAPISFSPISFEALTSFFAFDLTLRRAGEEASLSFTMNAPLHGAPADRRERLLRALLRSRDQVLRLLLLLLAEGEVSVADVVIATTDDEKGEQRRRSSGEMLALLEPLMRAVARDPRRLDDAARLIEDLRRTPEGAALLPEDLAAIWAPIWKVRQGELA